MKIPTMILLMGSALSGVADVTLPKVLTSNMVLQRDVPITIWGWADAGEKVAVDLSGKSASATANAQGAWSVKLPKQSLGNPLTLTVKGNNEIKLENILMGDVWLCSGQSNMEWGIGMSENPSEAIAAADHPTLRLFDVSKKPLANEPKRKDIVAGLGWEVCTPESLAKTGTRKGFSAVGYYFGKHLQDGVKGVPIGLIDASWGGANIEPWTTAKGWSSVPELKTDFEKMKSIDLSKAKLNQHNKFPSLYNGMIYGLTPLAIKGCIWYQGESNRKDGALYHQRKKALINGWRQIWGEEMPFYFVQLAPFAYTKDKKPLLPIIWETQSKSNATIPHTGMAVTIDIGNPKNIHPLNKNDVGKRLALLALKDTYGKDVVAYSPTVESHQIKKGKVVITFKDVGAGLTSRDGAPLSEFEMAGDDGKFVVVDAEITGRDTVTLSRKDLSQPAKVRFSWSNTPKPNLMNKEGLPVASFRFDVSR